MLKKLFPFSAVLLLAGCMGAGGGLNTPTAGEFAGILESNGNTVKIEADDDGAPMLAVNEGGDNFFVAFYDCKAGGGLSSRRCTGAEFTVSYPVEKRIRLSQINKLNEKYRMAKVYLNSDREPSLSLALNTGGGMTREHIADGLEWWIAAMRGFEKDIGWK